MKNDLLLASLVRLEGTGRCKFTEFVTHHVFSNVNWKETAAIVHIEIKSYKIGGDSGTTRPSLNRFAIVTRLSNVHLFSEVGINEESFFNGT